MDHTQEINNAIGAHGMWENRLKAAIDSGKIDTAIEVIRTNNQCAFGKWLYGPTLTATDKASAQYKTVADLHTRFHTIAAKIAELATAGKKAEAAQLLGSGGEFADISAKLTAAMMNWKKMQTPEGKPAPTR